MGTEGNGQLTTVAGALLLPLLAVIGVTLLQLRTLLWVHLFVGMLLIGPLALKMGSTGYRFVRYYAGNWAGWCSRSCSSPTSPRGCTGRPRGSPRGIMRCSPPQGIRNFSPRIYRALAGALESCVILEPSVHTVSRAKASMR